MQYFKPGTMKWDAHSQLKTDLFHRLKMGKKEKRVKRAWRGRQLRGEKNVNVDLPLFHPSLFIFPLNLWRGHLAGRKRAAPEASS